MTFDFKAEAEKLTEIDCQTCGGHGYFVRPPQNGAWPAVDEMPRVPCPGHCKDGKMTVPEQARRTEAYGRAAAAAALREAAADTLAIEGSRLCGMSSHYAWLRARADAIAKGGPA